jgi:recombination protein RecA
VTRKPLPKPASRASDAQRIAHEVNKMLGTDSMRLGNHPDYEVSYISTGIVPIDMILGGGFARGRITEMFGDFSTMKSFVCYRAIAECQSEGGLCALVDTEGTYDPLWASLVGVEPSALILPGVDTAEAAMDATDVLVRSGELDLICWDSVAASIPRDEAEHMESGEKRVQPGRQAALMSRGLRKLNSGNRNTAIVFTNQTRMNIGVSYGNPETTPGGKALPFYASVRLNLRKAGKVAQEVTVGKKKMKVVTGQKVRVSLDKSKLNAPHRDTTLTFDHRLSGVDDALWLLQHGVEFGYVHKSGHKYTINGNTLTYESRALEWLRNNPNAVQKLKDEAWKIGTV